MKRSSTWELLQTGSFFLGTMGRRETCTSVKENFQVKEPRDALNEKLREEPIEEPVYGYTPQSSCKSDTDVSESEDPEEDQKEEIADDFEVQPEEDSVTKLSGEPDENSAIESSKFVSPVLHSRINYDAKQPVGQQEFASELSPQINTGENDLQSGFNHNHSREKKRPLGTTASDSDQLKIHQSQKKFRQEEAMKSDAESAVTDLHGKSAVAQDIPNDESAAKGSEHSGSSGKRRRSRWELEAEHDCKTIDGNKTSKRRKSRWDTDVSQLKMLGPIQLPDFKEGLVGSELDPESQKLKARLIELNSILLSSVLQGNKDEEKSSQPVYNSIDMRTNTQRTGRPEKLMRERQNIISKLIKKNSTFKTPPDYKPRKLSRKLYIPVKEYPTYNFVGLIIGPRGNTQKRMEKETGAKIVLRGKGSVKTPQKPGNSDDDDLHVYIEAGNQKSLDAAIAMVEKLLIPINEGANVHKRAQLAELAKLNGTCRDGNTCRVCHEQGHKHYACPFQQSNFEMAIPCATCGSFCHPASSCPLITPPRVETSVSSSSGIWSSSVPGRKGKPNKAISYANLYVGCLPQAVDENRLRELFCMFGNITAARVVKDRITGCNKGYGFVEFESSTDAATAMTHMHGQKMDGKKLIVRLAGDLAVGRLSVQHQMDPEHSDVATDVPCERAWPGPPGSELYEGQASFVESKVLGVPSHSISSGHFNHLPESEDILPSVHTCSLKPSTSFDLLYRFTDQISCSSPRLQ